MPECYKCKFKNPPLSLNWCRCYVIPTQNCSYFKWDYSVPEFFTIEQLDK